MKDGFDWKPATVVSVDNFSGWVEARPDATRRGAIPRPLGGEKCFRRATCGPAGERKAAPAAPDAPVRKWSDKTGKFSVDARYQGTNGDKVVLAKADGKRIEVPIAKLSDEDGRYLQELRQSGRQPVPGSRRMPRAPADVASRTSPRRRIGTARSWFSRRNSRSGASRRLRRRDSRFRPPAPATPTSR